MNEVMLNENFDSSHACLNTGRQEYTWGAQLSFHIWPKFVQESLIDIITEF